MVAMRRPGRPDHGSGPEVGPEAVAGPAHHHRPPQQVRPVAESAGVAGEPGRRPVAGAGSARHNRSATSSKVASAASSAAGWPR